jgi:hypothetical protein
MSEQGQYANQPISFEATVGELVHEIANPLTGDGGFGAVSRAPPG